METKQIDLQPFCDTEDVRYALSTPWVKGGWRYATDGRICVRVTTDEADSPTYNEDGLKRPGADRLFDDFPPDGFEDMPKSLDEQVDDAPDAPRLCECAKLVLCPKCKGDDWCDKCVAWEGEIVKANQKCETCGGKGELPRVYQGIGNEWFDKWYLDKMRALPNLLVQSLDKNRLAFVFDGGEGLLMSVRNVRGKKPCP